ncbi:MAG: GntR family transcriptional regulator [Gemmatimonas sp.]|nr:GntR family transcriptional regulator [Gemmatimonas sp.]
MFSRIDPRSPVPIYAQIADRVRVAIAAGDLKEGDALPSVRALAAELRVNPATIVQAYRALERESIVELRQGAGTFIAPIGAETKTRERGAAARRLVREMLAEATRLGLTPRDVRVALDKELPEDA